MTGGGDIIKAKADKVAEMKSMAGDVSQVVSQGENEDPTMNVIQFFPKDYRVSDSLDPINLEPHLLMMY